MITLGILGDFNPNIETHIATNRSVEISAAHLGIDVRPIWMPTGQLSPADTRGCDALLVGTGVYENRDAVLEAVRIARTEKIPTLGMCGGFQHMIIEYARNALGLRHVGHAEFDPEVTDHVITPLQCSLKGTQSTVRIEPDSQVGQLYQATTSTERFYCAYGINPEYLPDMHRSPLRIVGEDEHGQARVTELSDHPFFIGTLFVPQAKSLDGERHPLIDGLITRARAK